MDIWTQRAAGASTAGSVFFLPMLLWTLKPHLQLCRHHNHNLKTKIITSTNTSWNTPKQNLLLTSSTCYSQTLLSSPKHDLIVLQLRGGDGGDVKGVWSCSGSSTLYLQHKFYIEKRTRSRCGTLKPTDLLSRVTNVMRPPAEEPFPDV